MPVASLTRSQVRQNIGRTGRWLWGQRTFQVTAATFGSVAGSVAGHLDAVDLALGDAQSLEGKFLYLGAGPGAGLSRVIVSTLVASPVGVPSGARLYPDRAMSFIPSTNNALELWEGIDPVAVNDFIDDAVRAASLDLLDHFEDKSIVLASSTYAYNLPEASTSQRAFAYISEVWLEDLSVDDIYTTRLPIEYWDIDRTTRPHRLLFTEGLFNDFIVVGRKVRVVGQSFPRAPETDDTVLDVDPEYVRKAALVGIWDSLDWTDMNRSRRDRYEREVKDYLDKHKTPIYPDSISVEAG